MTNTENTLQSLESRLLYRDGLMLVIDKPAGIPVHKGPKGGENLEQHFDSLRFGLPKPPALAHRLDKETSGCLVLGRHAGALRTLGNLFSSGKVQKIYHAVVVGSPPEEQGRIDLPLAKKSASKSSWWMKIDPNGQPSLTEYRVLQKANGLSWLELKPITGRTHQLRVHLSAIGCPILGDKVYGEKSGENSQKIMHLHSYSVELPLYPKKPSILVTATLPEHMMSTLREQSFKI